jgi:hypothetical protein
MVAMELTGHLEKAHVEWDLIVVRRHVDRTPCGTHPGRPEAAQRGAQARWM